MAMPGVKLEFKQLTSPGPPATQYLLVHFSRCNLIQPMTSRRDFWPRGKCRIGQNAEVRAPKKLTSDFCSEILMIESIKQSLNFNNMKKKMVLKLRVMCTLRQRALCSLSLGIHLFGNTKF